MELDDELKLCVDWLRTHIDFDIDGSMQMFEAVIRVVAGLTSGYLATGERFMLDGARELAAGSRASGSRVPARGTEHEP